MHLEISKRAARDIDQIYGYSVEQWGKKVAEDYLDSIDAALARIQREPSLLKTKPEASASLCFYRVQKHYLISALYEDSIFVLAIKHGAMDLPARLSELEPRLQIEAALLYEDYQAKRSQDN